MKPLAITVLIALLTGCSTLEPSRQTTSRTVKTTVEQSDAVKGKPSIGLN